MKDLTIHLVVSTALAVAFIAVGWGGPIITDLALIFGGLLAGHVLTELLNDPSE